MASYNQLCASTDGFGVTVPTTPGLNADIPLTWEYRTEPSAYHPFGLDRGMRQRWWRRLRNVAVELQILDGLYDLEWGLPGVPRTHFGTGDGVSESDLRFPGIPVTHGQDTVVGPFRWPGSDSLVGFAGEPLNYAELSIDIWIFAKHAGGHDHMQCDGALWYPSVVVQGSMSVAAGPEYAYNFSSIPLGEGHVLLGTFDSSFFPAHGGGTLPIFIYGPEDFPVGGLTMAINPSAWFTWDGKYSASTGLPV